MRKKDALRVWGRVLTGRFPALSIEITRECPLRCPGCYAYEPEHLQTAGPLRSLVDFKGQELVDNILALVDRHRPVHLSIVGGEPLVRFRELDLLLPELSRRGVAVQLVTSAVREIPAGWSEIDELYLVVSIDGLQPEHDERRKPATYERILRNIAGHRITVHNTVTAQAARQPGYHKRFLEFWSARPEVKQIWFSLFTPQTGATDEEILDPHLRDATITELSALRDDFPKLVFPDTVVKGFRNPPKNPDECIFARATLNVTADLKTRITPCQFGGDPDCTQCGCLASVGMAAVAEHRLFQYLAAQNPL